jgi:two-component system sensor histidine kinase BaeS
MKAANFVSSSVRLSIRHKLFLTLLLATTLVVAAMYGFMHWSFQHGFVNFLETRQHERVEQMSEQLAEIYVAEGGWEGLRQDRRRWLLLMAENRGMHGMGMGPGHGMGLGPGHGPGGGPLSGEGGIVLLDADKSVLIGGAVDVTKLDLSPISINGRAVGYLGHMPNKAMSDLVDIRFVEAQRRAFVWIALLVGVLAVALSWPLANALVRPLQRVTAAARSLAAGHLQVRVPVQSNDELGDLARDFNDMAQTLERTEMARRQWMADISHELRTPLSVLRAELEALQDGVRPMAQSTVSSLQSDVERLNRLVEDLYQLSMTDLGAMSYHKRPVDPVALLRDDVESTAGEFERKGMELSVRDELGHAVTLHADPDRLSQLFRNLMQNSLRYTDAGGKLVIVAGRKDGMLTLDFCDSAPGVNEETRPLLFERFYRVESSRNRAHGGAGLGLAICRNIVEAHGGRIEARPSPLGGLCLHVELPANEKKVSA